MQPKSVALVAAFTAATRASYVLVEDYNANSLEFFDKFNFFTGDDPTHGTVQYVDQETASSNGLIDIRDGNVYMGVDFTTQLDQNENRQAVRIEGKNRYDHGLFITDIAHMPGGICGTWPSWWMLGDDSDPNTSDSTGEIDIIENYNLATNNTVTIYSYIGTCDVNDNNNQIDGIIQCTSCFGRPDGTGDCADGSGGCETDVTLDNSFGQAFNNNSDNSGGVYALEWTSEFIAVYFIPRATVDNFGDSPSGPLGSSPDPQEWNREWGISPIALYSGSCELDNSFRKLKMIFNIALCGDSASGENWDNGCASSTNTNTCEEFVRQNPSAFEEAYWLLKSVKVYQDA